MIPEFRPLDSVKLNVREVLGGKVVPTAPIGYGVVAGSPLVLLVLGALNEGGVHLGPSASGLLGIALSALIGYVTRAGRRRATPRTDK
jgi:hypothetical protein